MAGSAGAADWADAMYAAALFAVDPSAVGGLVLRSGAGPVRDAWMELLRDLLPADAIVRRCPLNISDDRLLGGLDLSGSLAAGRPVAQSGVLAEADGGVVLVAMAERLSDAAGARIAAVLDDRHVQIERSGLALRQNADIAVVLLDEGLGPDERPPTALVERCAFHLDIEQVGVRDLGPGEVDRDDVAAARARLHRVGRADDALLESLCEAATALGVGSARAPLLALRVARAVAALDGREAVTVDDIATAARFVLAPRATRAPQNEVEDAAEDDASPPPEDSTADAETESARDGAPPADVVIAAARAALPEAVLNMLNMHDCARGPRSHAGGAGARVVSAQRGRPVGSRSGALRSGDRLNVAETLRAAAPWQKLRGAGARVEIRREDFRIRRFIEQRESTTIFVVDASGSAAFQRLAEAKGAVELMLATAYVSRARVALVSFRNFGAEILLPPTRSLTRARRLLATLPGGGGTPLAHGIEAGFLLAQTEKAKGRTPTLLLLTDGRANIARDGAPGRVQAEADALQAARQVRAAQIAAIHVDTAPRPRPGADGIAHAMGARYAPLPYVDARAVLGLVNASPS